MRNDKAQLPDGDVVKLSDIPRGEVCTRCGGFIEELPEAPHGENEPRIFRFEHKGYANNNASKDRLVSPHRSGFLCPDCEAEFREEFLGGGSI